MGSTISSGKNIEKSSLFKLKDESKLDTFVDNIFTSILNADSIDLKYRKLENLSDLLIFIRVMKNGEYGKFSLVLEKFKNNVNIDYESVSFFNGNIKKGSYHNHKLLKNTYDINDFVLIKKVNNVNYYKIDFDNDLLTSKIFNGISYEESIYEKLFNRIKKVTDFVCNLEEKKKPYIEELSKLGEVPLDNMELCIKKDKIEKCIESIKEKLSKYNRSQLFNIEILKECFKMTREKIESECSKEKTHALNATEVISSNEMIALEILPSAPSHEILPSVPNHEIAIAEVIYDNFIGTV